MIVDNRLRLGDMGERIVANYLNEKDCKVKLSTDPYDSKKDMRVDGKTCEVKTQVPYVFKDGFTIKPNQLPKCLDADHFLIVQAPCTRLDKAAIWSIREGFKYELIKTKDGREMILIPWDQETVVKKMDIVGKDKDLLRTYATEF
jgi:hypothetical protein|tara:strand:+ start:30 stop:464 length:435 start_codon:yes stop_codon:yes gene_type:complete